MKIKFQILSNILKNYHKNLKELPELPKSFGFTFPSPLGRNALNLPTFHIWVLGFKFKGVNFFIWGTNPNNIGRFKIWGRDYL